MTLSQQIRPPEQSRYPAEDLAGAVPGPLLAEISRAVVGIHREHFGRGPTRAKSHYDGELLVVVLGEVLTPLERLLTAAGMVDRVTELRRLAYALLEAELERAIAEVVGQDATITASQVPPDCDIGMHVFSIAPAV